MRCKDIKHLMIDRSPEELSRDEHRVIEQHAADCIECARLWDDLRILRWHVSRLSAPTPPVKLTQKIRSLCFAALQHASQENEKKAYSPSTRIPRYVWTALSLLIILTGIFIFPFFKEMTLSPSFQSLMTLTLIVQNAVMLCFSPILFRKLKNKNQDLII